MKKVLKVIIIIFGNMSVKLCLLVLLMALGTFSKGSHPFVVALVHKSSKKGHSYCGSSLVTVMTVVTAGHCVAKVQPNEIKLVAGVHNENTKEASIQERMVHSILKHPQFRRDTYKRLHYDIGLVHANAPFFIKPPFTARVIQLPSEPSNTKPPDGLALSLLGWGHILDGTSPYILQNGTFTVKGDRECDKALRIRISIDSFCVYGFNGMNGCQGDSGGPLYHIQSGRPVLYGVFSQASLKCSVPSYGMVANVIHFVPWIRQNSRN